MIFTADYKPMPLPYDVCDFRGFLSCANIQDHYGLYMNFVRTFNTLRRENPQHESLTPEEILTDPYILPWQVRQNFVDAAGGVYNHEVVFNSMTPQNGGAPSDVLSQEITDSFGSIDRMKTRFTDALSALDGSGYISLIRNPAGTLTVISMPNNESSLVDYMYPILMLDVWEHAYASNFFDKANYIDKWFDHLNWNYANKRYATELPGDS